MYLGWIGFAFILVGIFLPWGTYETTAYPPPAEREIRWISGITWSSSFYLIVGCVAALAGLLSSNVKASKVTVAFLGSGALVIILAAGLFISSYYTKVYVYPQILDLWIGSFFTLIGGICELLAAFLYTQHARPLMKKEEVVGVGGGI